MATTTMLNLPVATSIAGSESIWIVQAGTDKRTTIADAFSMGGFPSSALSPIDGLTILANNSTAGAAPIAQTLTQTFDANYGTTQNFFITRDTTGWITRALVGNDLPNPTTGSLGGVFVSTNPTNQWMTGITASGSASYTTIPASQLVQGITGSTGSAVVLSSQPRLYSPVVDGGGGIFTSTASGSSPSRPLLGQTAGYNVVFTQSGGFGLQIGSSLIGDAKTAVLNDDGFLVTNGNGSYSYFFAKPGQFDFHGSSLALTNLVFSAATNSSATFPAGTYTVVGTTAAGTSGQIIVGQTGTLPEYRTMGGAATLSSAGNLTLTSSVAQAQLLINAIQIGRLGSANLGSVTDQAISITSPSTIGYIIDFVTMLNFSSTTVGAIGGVYTGSSKSGLIVVSSITAWTATSTGVNTSGNNVFTGGVRNWMNSTSLYFSLTSSAPSSATADLYIWGRPLYP